MIFFAVLENYVRIWAAKQGLTSASERQKMPRNACSRKSNSPSPRGASKANSYQFLGIPSPDNIKKWNDLEITVFVLKYTIPQEDIG